jgi:hypothetical protein
MCYTAATSAHAAGDAVAATGSSTSKTQVTSQSTTQGTINARDKQIIDAMVALRKAGQDEAGVTQEDLHPSWFSKAARANTAPRPPSG